MTAFTFGGHGKSDNFSAANLTEEASPTFSGNLDFAKLVEEDIQLDPPVSIAQNDLDILAKVIWKESGGCPWEHQCAVGCVVINRVHDERFPDTVAGVVGQPGQYSTAYLSDFEGIPAECYDAAAAVLSGQYTIPPEVVWQANIPQGNGIWRASYVDTGWWRSTTYFCW